MANSEGVNTTSHLPTGTRLWPLKRYTEIHRRSLDDVEGFWAEEARKLKAEALGIGSSRGKHAEN